MSWLGQINLDTSETKFTRVKRVYEEWEREFMFTHNLTSYEFDILVTWAKGKMKVSKVTAHVMTNIVHDWNTKMRFSGETTNRIWYDGEYFGG